MTVKTDSRLAIEFLDRSAGVIDVVPGQYSQAIEMLERLVRLAREGYVEAPDPIPGFGEMLERMSEGVEPSKVSFAEYVLDEKEWVVRQISISGGRANTTLTGYLGTEEQVSAWAHRLSIENNTEVTYYEGRI